ncbi:MAG TPA: hypothetical protein VFF16_21045, partial [Telluria sp.]|nr:hypothetical protein [Telluria sp.]
PSAASTDVTIRSAHAVQEAFHAGDDANWGRVVIYRLSNTAVSVYEDLYMAPGAERTIGAAFGPAANGLVDHYEVYDLGANGTHGKFSVNGGAAAEYAAGAPLTVAAADLATLKFIAPGTGTEDTIMVRAFNGSYWGDWAPLKVSVGLDAQAPVVRPLSDVLLTRHVDELHVANLFTADAGAEFYDVTFHYDEHGLDHNGLSWIELNGATALAHPYGVDLRVSAADFAKLMLGATAEYTTGTLKVRPVGPNEVLGKEAWLSIQIPDVHLEPHSHTAGAGQTIAFDSLFTLAPEDLKDVRYFVISPGWPVATDPFTDSGYGTLNLNGAIDSGDGSSYLRIAAGELSKLTYKLPLNQGSFNFTIRAEYAANRYSSEAVVQVKTVGNPSILVPHDTTVAQGQSVALADLVSLAPNASATFYKIIDPSGGGSVTLGEGVINLRMDEAFEPGVIIVQASDLANVRYTGSAAAGSEILSISALTGSFAYPSTQNPSNLSDMALAFGAEVGVRVTSGNPHANWAPTGAVSVGGTLQVGATLSVQNTLSDADGLGRFQYQWFRDGQAIATDGAAATYVLTPADNGKAMSVRVSYIDGAGVGTSVDSAATSAVGAAPNTAPGGAVTVAGTATQGQMLSAVSTLTDADGLGTLHYQWLRGGVAIDGATVAAYTLQQADVGAAMSVRVTYVDALGHNESVDAAATAAVANVNDAPTGGVAVSGTPLEGQTLGVISTLADLDGLGALGYAWLRDGVPITGASGATYSLTAADAGHAVSVRATYVDGFGATEQAVSAPVQVQAPPPPPPA